MSLNLNPWVALVLGILIGWLLEWIWELLFSRKQRIVDKAHIADVEAQLKERDGQLAAARARVVELEGGSAGAQVEAAPSEVEAVAPAVDLETPEADLGRAAVIVAATGAAGELTAEAEAPVGEVKAAEVALEAPEAKVETPTVAVEGPEVEAGLPGVALAAPGIGLGGAAVAAGLAAVALSGEKAEAGVEAPVVEAEIPAGAVEAPEVESAATEAPEARLEPAEIEVVAPEVELATPAVAVAAPGIGLGGAAVAAAGAAAVVAGEGEAAQETRAGEVAVAVTAPPPVARIEVDDLTQIKGIGPKYAAQLNGAGIATYAALAHTPADRLKEIVDAPAWRQVDYQSWTVEARALAEAPRRMVVGDDFTTLEGIGPVYEAKLKHAGIATFAQLAASDESSLKEIIQAPAWRRVYYGEWIAQAGLAAAGDEAGLRAMQAELFSRGGDNIALIAGVGEKNAAALSAAGITTYAALAESSPEQLAAITKTAGVRAGDFDAWIEEARTRAAGKRVKRTTRAAGAAIGAKVSCPQDLSRIHGVGAVYETKLYAAGIGTYWELSEIADQDLVRVLDVQDFQAVDIVAVKADALKLAEETDTVGRYWDGTPPDDFEKLEGIGEVYERRLYDAGVCTFRALAAVTEEQLQEICQAPDWRRPDYGSWIAQAQQLIA
jgi:predicted flap endonuclease-1-like 5' DNA nuclease